MPVIWIRQETGNSEIGPIEALTADKVQKHAPISSTRRV